MLDRKREDRMEDEERRSYLMPITTEELVDELAARHLAIVVVAVTADNAQQEHVAMHYRGGLIASAGLLTRAQHQLQKAFDENTNTFRL